MKFVLLLILTPILLLWCDEHILTMFIKSGLGRTLVCAFLWIVILIVGAIFWVDLKSFDDSSGGGGGGGSRNDSNDWFNNNSANF